MSSFTHPANEHKPAPGLPLGPMPIALKDIGLRTVPIASVKPSPFNPRGEASFVKAELEELAETFKQVGILQPILVRPLKGGPLGETFEIMGGERRWRAAKIAKLDTVPIITREASDDEARVAQLVENGQRKDLTAIEEANYYADLQKSDAKKWTSAAIGRLIGKSDRYVSQRISIATNLAAPYLKALTNGELSIEQARTLAVFPKSVQTELPDWAVNRGADEIRRLAFDNCIPESAAKFDLTLYKGEYLEDGKKRRYFSDTTQFRKLQQPIAEKKLEEVRKDWPTAELISTDDVPKWYFADTPYSAEYNSCARNTRDGDEPAKYLVPKERCHAIVWIATNGEIRKAMGVCTKAAIEAADRKRTQARSSTSSRSVARNVSEKPDHRKARLAFNVAITRALTKRTDLASRWQLFQVLTNDDMNPGLDIDQIKKLVPAELRKFDYGFCKEEDLVVIWKVIDKLKIVEVNETNRQLTLASAPEWQDFEWHKPPAFMVALAQSLGVKVPDIALPKPPATAAQKAVSQGKDAAKTKAKAKVKKHG